MAVLDLATAKTFLNINGTGSDAELALYVAAMPDVLEGLLGGPVEQRSITEAADLVDGGRTLMLRRRFATSVTSVTAGGSGGSTVDITDTYVHRGSMLRRKSGLAYSPQTAPMLTVYTAGIAAVGAVPGSITLAACIILGHLWDTQRGNLAAGPGDDYAAGNALPGLGFAVPNRAVELLQPWWPETSLVLG